MAGAADDLQTQLDALARQFKPALTCGCSHQFGVTIEQLQTHADLACPRCDAFIGNRLALAAVLQEELDSLLVWGRRRFFARQAAKTGEPQGYPIAIAGQSHYQRNLKGCFAGEEVTLLREPTNPYDPRAIAVVNSLRRTIGYIPRESFIHRVVHDEGRGATAAILNRTGDAYWGEEIDVVIDVIIQDEPLGVRRFRRNK